MDEHNDSVVTKELIKTEYIKLRERLGYQPSGKVFYQETDIGAYQVVIHFLTYSNLVKEMGGTKKTFGQGFYREDEYWESYARLVEKLEKTPTVAEWRYYNCKPLVTSYTKKFKKNWSELPSLFSDYIKDKSEWMHLNAFITPTYKTDSQIISSNYIIDQKYSQFIPPVLSDFLDLAASENNKNVEFERKVNLVFQMLGFDVQNYGQGTGRNPDGIAKATQFGYAVIIDAKARRDGYIIGTEDRKFIEYINSNKIDLARTGHGIVYFLIVSSNFKSIGETALKNISRETNIITTLITASSLLKILATKIQYPNKLSLDRLKNIFINQGLVTDKLIEKLIK